MPKQKINKTISKRIKISSTGKISRRHQLANGHLKKHKSGGALERAKKGQTFFKGELRVLKKMLGV